MLSNTFKVPTITGETGGSGRGIVNVEITPENELSIEYDSGESPVITTNALTINLDYKDLSIPETTIDKLVNIQEPTVIAGGPVTIEEIPDTDYRYMAFPYSGTLNQNEYTVNFPETEGTECDILIVGGGGSGGGRQGGGEGAGGIMFLENFTISGTKTTKVGKGGIANTNISKLNGPLGTNGIDSQFDTYIAYGGSTAKGFCLAANNFNESTNRFGSGGGAMGWNAVGTYTGYHAPNTRTTNTNLTIQGGASHIGGQGFQDAIGSVGIQTAYVGGCGGGAGSVGGDATPNNNTSYTGKAGDGGVGLYFGDTYGTTVGARGWFGGGGGGAGYGDVPGTGGQGGGGNGNVSGPGVVGVNGTGGGEGGWRWFCKSVRWQWRFWYCYYPL